MSSECGQLSVRSSAHTRKSSSSWAAVLAHVWQPFLGDSGATPLCASKRDRLLPQVSTFSSKQIRTLLLLLIALQEAAALARAAT